MYSVQNLTKKPIAFQGVTIAAYGTATFPVLNDYIALSRLANSGKIRYCKIETVVPVAETAAVEEKVETPVVAEPVVETPVVEDAKEEVVADVVEAEPVETEISTAKLFDTEVSEVETVEPKKSRKNTKKDSSK